MKITKSTLVAKDKESNRAIQEDQKTTLSSFSQPQHPGRQKQEQ